jgi:hypothetical protein
VPNDVRLRGVLEQALAGVLHSGCRQDTDEQAYHHGGYHQRPPRWGRRQQCTNAGHDIATGRGWPGCRCNRGSGEPALQLRDMNQGGGDQAPVADAAGRIFVGPPFDRCRHRPSGRAQQRISRRGQIGSQVPPGMVMGQM